jgi:hypothetical protein
VQITDGSPSCHGLSLPGQCLGRYTPEALSWKERPQGRWAGSMKPSMACAMASRAR